MVIFHIAFHLVANNFYTNFRTEVNFDVLLNNKKLPLIKTNWARKKFANQQASVSL